MSPKLPFSMKVLLENLLRYEDGAHGQVDDVKAVANWSPSAKSDTEIAYRPARVLMQDFTRRCPRRGSRRDRRRHGRAGR